MPNVSDMFPSRYVKAADLGGHDVTVMIQGVTQEKVHNAQGDELVWALSFQKASKSLILNRTNATQIAALYGPDTDRWVNKRITLYATKVKAFGEVHEVIRIRPQIPPTPKGGQPAAPAGPGNAPSAAVEEAGLDELEEVREQIEEEQGPDAGGWPTGDGLRPEQDDNPFELHLAVESRLEGKCAKFVDWCKSKHAQSNGPATEPMYQYISGVIDIICRNDVHRDVLAVLVGRHVNSDNPPGFDLVSQLLNWLPEEITVAEQGRTANQDYKPEYAACIRHIGELVMEARGQGTLGF